MGRNKNSHAIVTNRGILYLAYFPGHTQNNTVYSHDARIAVTLHV